MKLRNGKSYNTFQWEKTIHLAQLKASNSLIIPIRVNNEIIYDGICGNSYIIVKNGFKNKIIKDGLEKGYLVEEYGKIISKFFLQSQSYQKNLVFFKSIEKELRKNKINCSTISYID